MDYPLVFRSGGWCPVHVPYLGAPAPNDVHTYPADDNERVSIPITHPDYQSLQSRQAGGLDADLRRKRRKIIGWKKHGGDKTVGRS